MVRLIDVDELNKDLDLYDRDVCGHCGNEVAAGFEAARELIADAPTIDAEPVRHGRWVHDINNMYGCSECGARETMSPKKLKNYCPSCGAKMDLEEAEHENA